MTKKKTDKPRLNASDYKKEYDSVLKKKDKLEKIIRNRALELCKKFPDIVVFNDIKAKDVNYKYYASPSTQGYLHMIKSIEDHNAIGVQTSLFEDELSQEDIIKGELK